MLKKIPLKVFYLFIFARRTKPLLRSAAKSPQGHVSGLERDSLHKYLPACVLEAWTSVFPKTNFKLPTSLFLNIRPYREGLGSPHHHWVTLWGLALSPVTKSFWRVSNGHRHSSEKSLPGSERIPSRPRQPRWRWSERERVRQRWQC